MVGSIPIRPTIYDGDIAQLGERLVCNQEVTGSIPVISTKLSVDGIEPKVEYRKKKFCVRLLTV